MKPLVPEAPFKRFTVASAINGYEVVDLDGRPVDRRDTRRSANMVARNMNQRCATGGIVYAVGGSR